MVIYKIKNLINGSVYIGQTIRPLSIRWARHIADARDNKNPIARAIRKYGKEAFQVTVVIKCNTKEELNVREKMCIALFRSQTKHGNYNVLAGGEKRDFDQATLKRISEANIEAWQNPEYKKAMKESRVKSSLKRYKKRFAVYVAINKGFDENRKAMYEQGELVGTWENQIHCAKDIGVDLKNLNRCIRGKTKTCNGLMFRYI